MTPEEFKRKMQEICSNTDDREAMHGEADDLLCNMLIQLGYGDGVRVYEQTPKWYA